MQVPGELLYFCNGKIHFMVYWESEIVRLGSLINCSGKAAQTSHKLNVKRPGSNGPSLWHAHDTRPSKGDCTYFGKGHPRNIDVIICIYASSYVIMSILPVITYYRPPPKKASTDMFVLAFLSTF